MRQHILHARKSLSDVGIVADTDAEEDEDISQFCFYFSRLEFLSGLNVFYFYVIFSIYSPYSLCI